MLLRFANGSTTIDKQGATAGSSVDGAAWLLSVANPTGFVDVGDDLKTGQTHQAITAMTSMVATAAATARGSGFG